MKPGAARTRVLGRYGDRLKVEVAAPPEDGKANAALIAFLAKRLGVPVSLAGGASSRDKAVLVAGLDADEMMRRLMPQGGAA